MNALRTRHLALTVSPFVLALAHSSTLLADAPKAPPPPAAPVAPVTVEAEAGTLGADFKRAKDGKVEAVSIGTNGAGNNPGSAARVIRYKLKFPRAGAYELYARVKIGAQGANDDSMFFARTFGSKDPTRDADWILANNLGNVGQSEHDAIVKTDSPPVANGWRWINLSTFVMAPNSLTFNVPATNLEQTFEIGAREDGLEIDKLAFGPERISHTVSELEQQKPGRYIAPKPPPPPFTPQGPALASGHEKFLGGAFGGAQSKNFSAYFNQVTPENAGKWGSVEATRDNMVWGELDAAYQFAKKQGLPFKLHVLVWGNQQPAWLEKLPPKEQLEEIEEWYAAVAQRYPDPDWIEVVNEPLHDPPDKPGDGGGNYIKALGGDGKTGWDWVLSSFRMARKHFPRSRLLINEYSVLNTPKDAQRYKGIIKLLQAEKLVDGVGIQCHAFETNAATKTLSENLNLLAGLGLPIYITELDIDGWDDSVQLAEYKRVFPLLWEHKAVRGITLWGYRPGMWRTPQGAALTHEQGAERPALVWLRDYLDKTRPKNPKPTKTSEL
jgi:endo-1,4-beta-xylanase